MTAPAWRPDAANANRTRLSQFINYCGCGSLDELQQRSTADVAWFTDKVIRFLDVPFDPPYTEVVDLSRGIEWPRWCVGGGLNISSIADRQADARGGQPAVVWEGEAGATRTISCTELARAVARCAAGLRAIGLGKGDAIGIYLPMIPETVITLLATARIGAIAVPLFSGFGPQAIATRLTDVGARALIASGGFQRRGKFVDALEVALAARQASPTVEHLVIVGGDNTPGSWVSWGDLLQRGRGHGHDAAEATGAEDPLMVLYTSGTTGKPKGIVHSHCGFPIKAAQDMAFGTDVGPGDRILWVTDLGWMMGPWLIYGALINGATMVLYDGAPDFPEPGRIWSVAARHQVNVLGISPTLVRGMMAAGAVPQQEMPELRSLASTGEPWNPDPWTWLFEKVGRGRVPIINYSGGTEVSGGILMGNPLLPITPCGFSAPCPGMAADIYDDAGRPVRGDAGELVITRPWIGMARGFWKAPERYIETYWSRWPGVWAHGDRARIDADGQWYILGRSDDTIKVSGQRVGPAEVESVLVANPGITEAAVVSVPDERRGGALVAFCVPRPGAATPDLERELADAVARELGKPMRPQRVVLVPAIPKTRNAKVMRRLARAAYLGEDPGDMSALDNPDALDAIRRAGEELRQKG